MGVNERRRHRRRIVIDIFRGKYVKYVFKILPSEGNHEILSVLLKRLTDWWLLCELKIVFVLFGLIVRIGGRISFVSKTHVFCLKHARIFTIAKEDLATN